MASYTTCWRAAPCPPARLPHAAEFLGEQCQRQRAQGQEGEAGGARPALKVTDDCQSADDGDARSARARVDQVEVEPVAGEQVAGDDAEPNRRSLLAKLKLRRIAAPKLRCQEDQLVVQQPGDEELVMHAAPPGGTEIEGQGRVLK